MKSEIPASQNKVVLILLTLLIILFLTLGILTTVLFMKIGEHDLQLKSNAKILNFACEDGWLEFNDHCYFFSTFELQWENAELMCLNRESHLVIINSEAEQNFLLKNYNRRYFWIGLTDRENEGTFKWIDGTDLSYTAWHTGEPNDMYKNEDCVYINLEGRWNDYSCNSTINAMCEKRLT